MCKCRSHGTFPLFGLQSSHLNICYYHQDPHRRPLRPGSRPRFCSDRRALLLIGAWHLPRRPGVGRALKRHPFSGLVDSAGMLTLEPFSEDQGRSAVHPARGIPPISFLAPCGFTHPLTRTHVKLLGPCFKTGRMGCPQAGAGSTQLGLWPPHQSAPVHAPSRSTDRLSPFHIRPGRIAGPHSLPSRQFQALFDSLFKVLFIFPSRYLFAIGLTPVFSLGRNLPPYWGCIPKQPDSQTAPRGATGSGHDGALTLSGAPFQGTWARSAAEDASPDYNSDSQAARFSSWADPGSLAVTKGILTNLRPDAMCLDKGCMVGGDAMRDAQEGVPSAGWLWAQLAFKNSMVHGILQFTPSIAFCYVLHRCVSRDIRCRESFVILRRPRPTCTPRTGQSWTDPSHSLFSLAHTVPGFVIVPD
ncbi:hypothetical protein L2E82_09283 [Cichorium intybus]|uniref:Uncharacterized protein n=1 Tax=Cichorium intybus TaxID=13427 RepID=A0ACB9GA03_CICIN|nr:hypothetical protein L2E82_09283 [Cichorium intybus]